MCKVYNSGNGTIDIETPRIRSKPYKKSSIRKKSKTEYIDLETGEIIEVKKHSDNRASSENIKRLYKSMKYLQRLLQLNFSGAENEIIITILYDEKFSTLDKCYKDIKKFYSKLKTRLKIDLVYVIVVNFRSKENVYYELWLKAPTENKLIIDNSMLEEIWKNGKIFCSKIVDIIEQSNYIKDNSLNYFPAYCKLFRHSTSGILKPKPIIMTHAEAMVMVKNMQNVYKTTKLVTKTSSMGLEYAVNSVTYESFVDKKFIKKKGVKTMAEYINKTKEKAQEILENIVKSSNYKDVAEYTKLDYVAKDLQWTLGKVNILIDNNANPSVVKDVLNKYVSNTIANISVRNNFNLYQTPSYNGIRMLKDLLEFQKELFLQVRWNNTDRKLVAELFSVAISMTESTDIYKEIYNTSKNEN